MTEEHPQEPQPSLILSADAPNVPKSKNFLCLNGPCQGRDVNAPYDTVPGCACALPWNGPQGTKYAVYVVVEHHGQQGLMFLKSYDHPNKAAQRVREITAVCSVGVQH